MGRHPKTFTQAVLAMCSPPQRRDGWSSIPNLKVSARILALLRPALHPGAGEMLFQFSRRLSLRASRALLRKLFDSEAYLRLQALAP